jgi:CBS domain-containing protein
MHQVSDIMKQQVVTIAASDRLSTAEDIMTLGGVRHMPVVSTGRLVGVVSERDLLRASLSCMDLESDAQERQRAFLQGIEIASVMSTPPIVIAPNATVKDAALLMADHRIGCLPVVDPLSALVGMVTQTDVLLYFAEPVVDAPAARMRSPDSTVHGRRAPHSGSSRVRVP